MKLKLNPKNVFRRFVLATVASLTALSATGADFTVTTAANAIVVTDVSGNDDALIVSEPGAARFSSPRPPALSA